MPTCAERMATPGFALSNSSPTILITGNTVKAKEDWNPRRQASIERFAVGEVIQGPDFPELARPFSVHSHWVAGQS